MARDVLITPASGLIDFLDTSVSKATMTLGTNGILVLTGGSNPIVIETSTSGSSALRVDGTNGTLFEVVDDLSGSLMSVNDAAGLPVLEVFADSHIVAGRYGQNDFYLDTGGNLGLGTASPSQLLQIVATNAANNGITLQNTNSSGNSQVRFLNTSGSERAAITYINSSDAVYHYTGAGGNLLNLVGGNVGIGTVSPTSGKLVVNQATVGDNIVDFQNNGTTALRIDTANTVNYLYLDTQAGVNALFASAGNSYGGYMSFKNGAGSDSHIIGYNGVIFNETGADLNLRIEGDTDANLFFTDASEDAIGIGTASPAAKLNIAGDVLVNTNYSLFTDAVDENRYNDTTGTGGIAVNAYNFNGSSGGPNIQIANSYSTGWSNIYTNKIGAGSSVINANNRHLAMYTDGVAAWSMNVNSSYDLAFVNSQTGNLLLDPQGAGSVGIGTISPSAKLHVVGEIRATNYRLSGPSDGGPIPAYNNNDYSTVKYNEAERAIELVSSTDTSIGMAFPAFRVNESTGEQWKIWVQHKIGTASSTGVYFRIYEYNAELPSGKIAVSNDAGNSVVQEDTSGKTNWYENGSSATTWTTSTYTYTPTSGAKWASVVVLKWTTISANNPLYVRLGKTKIGGRVDGTGASNKVAYWTDSETLSSNTNFHWDNANEKLGIGTASPSYKLEVITPDNSAISVRATSATHGILIGGAAYSTSNAYMGMKTSYMTGIEDYMIISGISDGNTYVSSKSGSATHLRGGGNNGNNEVVMSDGGNNTYKATGYHYFQTGSVGIGGAPSYPLHVVGKIYSTTEGQFGSAIAKAGTSEALFGSNSLSIPIKINLDASASRNDLVIQASTGNVGINTASPSAGLHVNHPTAIIGGESSTVIHSDHISGWTDGGTTAQYYTIGTIDLSSVTYKGLDLEGVITCGRNYQNSPSYTFKLKIVKTVLSASIYGTVEYSVNSGELQFYRDTTGYNIIKIVVYNDHSNQCAINWNIKERQLNSAPYLSMVTTATNNSSTSAPSGYVKVTTNIITQNAGIFTNASLLNSGSIGIGTTSPSTLLYVDNGISTFNRGNSAGQIAAFRGQNAEKASIGTATSYFLSDVGVGIANPGSYTLNVDHPAGGAMRVGQTSGAGLEIGHTAYSSNNAYTGIKRDSWTNQNAYALIVGGDHTFLSANVNGTLYLRGGGNQNIGDIRVFSTGEVVINEDGGNADFRVEGDTDTNLLRTDGSADTVGIGTSTPTVKLSVDGELSCGDGMKLIFIGLDINSQATPNFIKIRTKIPFASGSADFTVNIKGFQYGSAQMTSLTVGWHYYNSTFYSAALSSSGAYAPVVKLSAEDWDSSGTKKVCIVLVAPGYWPKLYVESMYSSAYSDAYANGWTWDTNDATATGSELVTPAYKSNFGNNFVMTSSGSVGIGTAGPTKPLTIQSNSEQLLLETSSSPTSFYATLSSRYDSAHPFALNVANNSLTSIEYFGVYADGGGANNRVAFPSGCVGIGTTSPSEKLHVVGNIKADNLELGSRIWYTDTVQDTGAGIANATIINWKEGTSVLSVSWQYIVELTTTGTSTDTGACYLVWYDNNNTAWNFRYISRYGSTSNQPLLTIAGTNNDEMAVYDAHTSQYTVRYTVESHWTEESDSWPTVLGPYYMWQRDVNNLRYDDGYVGLGGAPGSKLTVRASGVDDVTQGIKVQDTAARTIQIYGTGSGGQQRIETDGTTNAFVIGSVSAGPLLLKTNDSTAVTIDGSNQNVGIGVAPNANYKLYVNGVTRLNSASGAWNLIGPNGIDFARESRFGYSTSYPVLQLGTAEATRGIAIGVNVSGNASGLFQGNEIIIPNQRVIIAPTAANNSYISVLGIDSNDNIRIGYSNYALLTNNPGITIETATLDVGIGTAAPDYKLDVQDNASGTIARIRRTVLDQGNSGAVLLLELGENTGPENDPWIDFNNYGTGSGGGLAGSIATAQAQQGIRIHGNTNIDFDISSTLQSSTTYRQMKIDSSGATVYGNLGVGGSITANRTLTVNSINTLPQSTYRPAIKINNPNIDSSTASSGKTFDGWLPIDLDGTIYYIALYR